jgi:hypothetical protein
MIPTEIVQVVLIIVLAAYGLAKKWECARLRKENEGLKIENAALSNVITR